MMVSKAAAIERAARVAYAEAVERTGDTSGITFDELDPDRKRSWLGSTKTIREVLLKFAACDLADSGHEAAAEALRKMI